MSHDWQTLARLAQDVADAIAGGDREQITRAQALYTDKLEHMRVEAGMEPRDGHVVSYFNDGREITGFGHTEAEADLAALENMVEGADNWTG